MMTLHVNFYRIFLLEKLYTYTIKYKLQKISSYAARLFSLNRSNKIKFQHYGPSRWFFGRWYKTLKIFNMDRFCFFLVFLLLGKGMLSRDILQIVFYWHIYLLSNGRPGRSLRRFLFRNVKFVP